MKKIGRNSWGTPEIIAEKRIVYTHLRSDGVQISYLDASMWLSFNICKKVNFGGPEARDNAKNALEECLKFTSRRRNLDSDYEMGDELDDEMEQCAGEYNSEWWIDPSALDQKTSMLEACSLKQQEEELEEFYRDNMSDEAMGDIVWEEYYP